MTSYNILGGSTPTYGGAINCKYLSLTNAQIKALRATPIDIIPAQGVGTFIYPLGMIFKMIYGGNNAFVTVGVNLDTFWTGSTSNATNLIPNSVIIATTTTYAICASGNQSAVTTLENTAIQLKNSGTTEITGNAANDNTATLMFWYMVLTI